MYPADETLVTAANRLAAEHSHVSLAALTEIRDSKQNTSNDMVVGHGEPEVIEESGPVQYHEEEAEDEEEEEGLDDEAIEGLAYDEDPLLHSDYEDEGTSCRSTHLVL